MSKGNVDDNMDSSFSDESEFEFREGNSYGGRSGRSDNPETRKQYTLR